MANFLGAIELTSLTPGDDYPRCEIRLAIAKQKNPNANSVIGMLFTEHGRLACDRCEFVEQKQPEPDRIN